MNAALRCHCGQRVFTRDVTQKGVYVRHYGPAYIYIRYRCSRCKKLGEQFIKQEEWDERALLEEASEGTPAERQRFSALGPITDEEIAAVRLQLRGSSTLPRRLAE